MHIERLKVTNFKAFRSVVVADIPKLAFFVGANGSGKSTLFDVFGFLRDALQDNVHAAVGRRGGFRELRSRGEEGTIGIEIKFRYRPDGPLASYKLEIDERDGRAFVARELLKYRRGQHGRPWHFLDFRNGEGTAVTNEIDAVTDEAQLDRETQKLDSPDILALKGLGQFERFKVASSVRRLIERWHNSDFHISAARQVQDAGHAEHLSAGGENLSLVTQYLFRHHRKTFDDILQRMARRVPGVTKVEAEDTIDGRVVLRFQDGAFKDPFVARYVSDGTIKVFAYLVLLSDPNPHPLLSIEEPEKQLYPTLLYELVDEFRQYSQRGGQVMVSTHSPDLLNWADQDEVYWLEKRNGFTMIHRASGDAQLSALIDAGDPLGQLWTQGLLGAANP